MIDLLLKSCLVGLHCVKRPNEPNACLAKVRRKTKLSDDSIQGNPVTWIGFADSGCCRFKWMPGSLIISKPT